MRQLDTVSCSLNLGLIYSLNYSYSPESGVSITIFFVNESGEYNPPNMLPMQKANIMVGPISFSMYPKSYKISKSAGRRVISVDFVDEMFMLGNYYIVLKGRGCGEGIYELGSPVDKRTESEKLAMALDDDAQRIKEFTQFPDLEYTFLDLLDVIRQKFSVETSVVINSSITRDTQGTFRSVLDDWCSFLNISYFFENGEIKIYDPTNLAINIPSQYSLQDALSYEVSEDIGSTYSKTVCNYFEQEGGEVPYNADIEDGNSPSGKSGQVSSIDVRSLTLSPIENMSRLPQTSMDLKQIAAAMYGQEFWMLYNLWDGTWANCGWANAGLAALANGAQAAIIDEKLFNEKFEAYNKYGREVAGRWYLSDEIIGGLEVLEAMKWYSEADGAVFKVDSSLANERAISPIYLEPPSSASQRIKETIANQYFPGLQYNGKRMAFYDAKDKFKKTDGTQEFTLTEAQSALVNAVFQGYRPDGSKSINWSGLGSALLSYSAYFSSSVPDSLITIMQQIKKGEMEIYLKPTYGSYPIKGAKVADVINRKQVAAQPKNKFPVSILPSIKNPVLANTSTIKIKKEGSYITYYDKYNLCVSRHSVGGYFQRKFDIEKMSTDGAITFEFKKNGNSYIVNRNYAAISAKANNPFLQSLAQSRTFPTKTVSFTTNYYYRVPFNFLSNGLVGMQMGFNDSGLICSYTFSNSILVVPNAKKDYELFENSLKYSTIRHFEPKQVAQIKNTNI